MNNNLYEKTETLGINHAEAFNLAKHSLDFLAGIAMPLVTKYIYPSIFTSIWQYILEQLPREREFIRIAIGYPRGFGKTTFIKLVVLYCILFSSRRFIVICNNVEQLAINTIADITSALDEPNIKAIFGDWTANLEIDRQDMKKFAFRGRTIILVAIGQRGSVRGLNIDNCRPDVMIMDDIQSREEADSEKVSEDILIWMLGTFMKAASHEGCLYCFLGNMYPTKNSILKKLKLNPEWVKFIVGGIKVDGTSLWEELKPLKQLLAEYRTDLNSGHPEIFYSEVLNDENAKVNQVIDISKIPEYPFLDDEIITAKFIVIDPSNDKVNSDSVSIGLFVVINGKPVCLIIEEGKFSPGDTITKALRLAVRYGVSTIFSEANAYQYSLLFWFRQTIQQYGLIGVQIEPIYSGKRSKNSRILDMFKSLLAGEIFLHPNCSALAINQILQFNALKTDNVDGILDLLTYAVRILNEMPHLLVIDNVLVEGEYGNNTIGKLSAVEDTCLF